MLLSVLRDASKESIFAGAEAEGVEEAEGGHEEAPPEGGVKVGEDCGAGMPELDDALAEDDGAAGEHEDADEEPDGEPLLGAGIDVMGSGHGVLLGDGIVWFEF